MWTGQANIGLQWLYGLCAACALTALYEETDRLKEDHGKGEEGEGAGGVHINKSGY